MKNLIITIALSFISLAAFAQFECSDWAIGLDFNTKTPLGELKDNGLTTMYGGNVEVFYLGLKTDNFVFAPGLRFSAGSTEFKYGETFDLEFPVNGTATERRSTEHGNFIAAARVIWTKNNKFLPYAEVYTGSRDTRGYDRLRINEDVDGFVNTTEELFYNSSRVTGAGAGLMYNLGNGILLNAKVTHEWTKEVAHLDMTTESYSKEKVMTKNTSNLGINIGIVVVPGCRKSRRQTKDYGDNLHLPINTKPVQVGGPKH